MIKLLWFFTFQKESNQVWSQNLGWPWIFNRLVRLATCSFLPFYFTQKSYSSLYYLLNWYVIFSTFINDIFSLPLPFFHSLNLNQLTPSHWCIDPFSLNTTKPFQEILPHIFIINRFIKKIFSLSIGAIPIFKHISSFRILFFLVLSLILLNILISTRHFKKNTSLNCSKQLLQLLVTCYR